MTIPETTPSRTASAATTPDAGRAAALTINVSLLPGEVADRASSAVVVLAGRLDAVEAVQLRQEFGAVLQTGATFLLVDLSDVDFVDSAGLAALIRARREVESAGGAIVLVSPRRSDALRVFRLTQFDEVFRMVEVRGAR